MPTVWGGNIVVAPHPGGPVSVLADQLLTSQAVLAGRYRLLREIGSGGAATVYLAEDQKHRRDVAVKLLRPELASALGGAFFVREIGIAANLQHPHIVPLYDSGESDGLLYYVMPFVDGESLRHRLSREGRLEATEAVRIAREVALALDYAHRRGVVHRDIKPDNILLSSGQAMVADFGIARAITIVGVQRLTGTGIFVGTPAYMSPEQATGSDELDSRSDIYSLGCVLFEMLTGRAPFAGSAPQQVLVRHATEPAPAVRTLRGDVDPALERCVQRALAKDPADRWQSAEELAAALAAVVTPIGGSLTGDVTPRAGATADGPAGSVPTGWRAYGGDAVTARTAHPGFRRASLAVVGGVMCLAAVWAVTVGRDDVMNVGRQLGRGMAARPTLDTARFAVLPFESDTPDEDTRAGGQLLEDALERWRGVSVVDPFQLREAIERAGGVPRRSAEARRVAEIVGAGRYVRANVTRIGQSLRVHARLYDTRTNALLSDSAIRVAPGVTGADAAFAALADHLLFRGDGAGARVEMRTGTTSFAARQAFGRGLAAIQQWNLAAADSEFTLALNADPNYAQAALWLAQTGSWSRAPSASWGFAAERALARRDRLSPRDQMLADALAAFASTEYPAACSRLRELTRSDAYDFAAWHSLATCLRSDNVVVRDSASPSRWRFRSSYHEALHAYQRSFRLLPSIHSALRGSSYERVRRLFMTSRNDLRSGRSEGDDARLFLAYPSWSGDSLLFVPYPERDFHEARAHTIPQSLDEAVRRQRAQFHQVATAWASAYPQSADALEAVAVSLEMRGDPSSLDSLRRARTLARSPAERLRVGASQVWMQLKFSIPHDLAGVRAARALADSLLRAFPPNRAPHAEVLASLATLTGRANVAAAYGRMPELAAARRVPAPLAGIAYPHLVYAALGGPADSLFAFDGRARAAVETASGPRERESLRLEFLARPATLAFPDLRLASITALAGRGDYLVDALAAWTRSDTAAVVRTLAGLEATRRAIPASDLTFDALFPEAWLVAALGDAPRAIRWLDPTFSSLRAMAPQVLATPDQAGPFVRAIALRAMLAERVGDRTSAKAWASLVTTLWSDADPFLQPTVERMKKLERSMP